MKTNEFDTDRIRIFISPYTIIIIKLIESIVKFYNNNTDCSFNRILANFSTSWCSAKDILRKTRANTISA